MNDRITINKTTKSVANEACIFFGWHDCIVYLYEREGWVLLKLELRRRHILVAHHLHGKTSRFTVEANNSKIQVINGGKFHHK